MVLGKTPNPLDHPQGHCWPAGISGGLDDLYRVYAVCQRDGTDFNLAHIPKTFTEPDRTDFDSVYMQKLYDFGFKDAKAGYHWVKQPPMLVGQEATPAKSR